MSQLFKLAARTFKESPIAAELANAARAVVDQQATRERRQVGRELSKYGLTRSTRASVMNAARALGLGGWLNQALKLLGGKSGDRVSSILDALGNVAKGRTKTKAKLNRELREAIEPEPTPPPIQMQAAQMPPVAPWDDWHTPDVPIVFPQPSSKPQTITLPPPPTKHLPPVLPQPTRPPTTPPGDQPPGDGGGGGDDEDGYPEEHGVQLFGRGPIGYDAEDTVELIERERRTPGSSNVYSYVYHRESRTMGILYVTFKTWHPGMGSGERPNTPGPTYAYFDVPVKKYQAFEKTAATSAGSAVWDYLRVRGKGNFHQHQHPYRLAAAAIIPAGGTYVPRKATALGFKSRSIAAHGVGPRSFQRSTLPERHFNRASPDRGTPDRGTPDRGN